jgi:nicotinate phosphoribosyltransferase
MKQSKSKVTYPGRKQIYRQVFEDKFIKDRLGLADESTWENEQPLLELVMKQGERIRLPETLQEIQKRTTENVEMLSPSIRQLTNPTHLPVEISDSLQQLTEKTQRH